MRKDTKINRILLALLVCITVLSNQTIYAKTKPVKGTDANGNTWTYNKKTNTLTFKGKKSIEEFPNDRHSKEPKWFCLEDDVKHIIVRKDIKGLLGSDFYEFMKLETVVLPDTITNIGSLSFCNCTNLRTIKMSKNIKKIGYGAFEGCKKLTDIDLGKKLTLIDSSAFACCSRLKQITIPDSVLNINNSAFACCSKLSKIKLPSKIKVLNENLFENCKKLGVVTIPNTVTTIYGGVFKGTGITQITVPKNVEYLQEGHWGSGIFADCKNLKTVTIKSKKIKSCFETAFKGISKDVLIKVPKDKLDEYTKLFQENGLDEKVQIIGF